jgi:hypothetical protein
LTVATICDVRLIAPPAFRDQKVRTDWLSNFDDLLNCYRLSNHSTL